MEIKFKLNGKEIKAEVEADTILLDLLREQGCYSVKRGCETANCGLCTVLMNKKSVLSCSILAAQADGQEIVTLEGMQKEAEEFGDFLANEGAEQCGFCNPGFIMNVFAMLPFVKTTMNMHFILLSPEKEKKDIVLQNTSSMLCVAVLWLQRLREY